MFSHDELQYDFIAASRRPTSFALSDGGEIAVTAMDTGFVLRRYAADGSVRRSEVESFDGSSLDIELERDITGDGFYLLAAAAQGTAALMRFDDDLNRQWRLSMPDYVICETSCERLEALPDGSVLALRASTLQRVGMDGSVEWQVQASAASLYASGGDMALGRNDDVWLAITTGAETLHTTVSIMRVSLDGTPLSNDTLDCSDCGGTQVAGIDVQDDGSAVMAGNTGTRGFLVRYDAQGSRIAWVSAADAAIGYYRVAHDDGGRIYVGTSTIDGPVQVMHIDTGDFHALWSAPAAQFTTRTSGVVAIRNVGADVLAVALDETGGELWSRTLPAGGSTYPVVTASVPDVVDDRTRLLVVDTALSDDACSIYPTPVALDAAGTLTVFPAPCRPVEKPLDLYSLSAMDDVGVLANLLIRLEVFSPDGDLRWQASACEWCDGYGFAESQWPAAQLTSDGGAWAVRWDRPSLTLPNGRTTIQRFDASGNVIAEIAAGTSAADDAGISLLGSQDFAVMLEPVPGQGLSWQGVRSDGSSLSTRLFAVADVFFHIDGARLLADGSVLLDVKGDVVCTVGCPPRYVTLLRIASNGDLLWRYQFSESEAFVALSPDGSALAAIPATGAAGNLLRRIGADGVEGSSIDLSWLPPDAQPQQLSGPIADRWLLRTDDRVTGDTMLWLIDANGSDYVQRAAPYSTTVATSHQGYLLSELEPEGAKAMLLDPGSLADKAQFPYGHSGQLFYDYGPWPWQSLDDGSVYGTLIAQRPWLTQLGLARYSAPGSSPSNMIFRDGFE